MASAFTENETQSFWGEVRKLRGKGSPVPNVVGNAHGPEAIGNLFSNKYKTLYNSVSYSDQDMQELKSETSSLIKSRCCNPEGDCLKNYCENGHLHFVTIEAIKNSVMHLKPGKQDGSLVLTSEHIIQGTNCLFEHLASLLSCMLRHGYSPMGFRTSTIVSIPKNKRKSMSDPDNYRGIALSSILGKVFD